MRGAPDLLTRWPQLDAAGKRARLQQSLRLSPGPLTDVFTAELNAADTAAGALWQRDPSMWSDDPAVQQTITKRLGWMQSPLLMAETLTRLQTFASAVQGDGITDVVLLGMGGSSLGPEVIKATLGSVPGFPPGFPVFSVHSEQS